MAISNYTSLFEGETALLACVGYGLPFVEISWIHDGLQIDNSSLISVIETDVVVEDRVFRQSVIQLCSVATSDSGDYVCLVGNGRSVVNNTVFLNVRPPQGEILSSLFTWV